jgi:integrase
VLELREQAVGAEGVVCSGCTSVEARAPRTSPSSARRFASGMRRLVACDRPPTDRAIVRAKLPRIRMHDLRHTHASLLLAAGVQPKVVSERLGHASIHDYTRHV